MQSNMSAFSISVMIETKHKVGWGDKEGRQEYIWDWSCVSVL